MSDPLRLSFSTIEMFEICARRYQLIKLEQVPRAPVPALIGGTAVHAALEADGLRRMAAEPLELAELLEHYGLALERTLKLEDPDGMLTALDEIRRQGEATMRAYSELVSRYEYWPVAIEQAFEFSLPDDIIFSGRIDAVTEPYIAAMERTVRTIIDFKTASRPWKEGDENRKDQATAYLLASQQSGQAAERVTFILLAYNADLGVATARPLPTQRTPLQVLAYQDKIHQAAAVIREQTRAGDFPARTGPQCAWCTCLGACAVGQSWLRVAQIRPRVPVVVS